MDALKFIQISDTHLFQDHTRELLGVNTQKSLRAVIDNIKKNKLDISFVIHSGDLSQDGSAASYQLCAQMLAELQVPVYCVPGNHDDAQVMASVFPYLDMSMQKQIVFDQWQLILLDTHQHAMVEGYLAPSELKWIETCIDAYPEHRAVLIFHHQPVKVGSTWLDNLGVKNSQDFWTYLRPFKQINLILFGHVHQESQHIFQNIKLYSTPSTCIQFMRNQVDFGLEKIGQGYRYVCLYPNGEIETSIHRLGEYVGNFDASAKGY